MNTIVDRFENIKFKITSLNPVKPVNIIAVSKTFSLEHIKPLIDHGHTHFGENKVQEAKVKWLEQKKQNVDLRLHMIGKLQRNKSQDAVKLFDYIHSLDNQKLADALAKHQNNMNKNLNQHTVDRWDPTKGRMGGTAAIRFDGVVPNPVRSDIEMTKLPEWWIKQQE